MDSKKNQMTRGVNQALYKYLPGSWIDFFIKDTRENFTAYVERWNSIHLEKINKKRLLRIIDRDVKNFRFTHGGSFESVVGFSENINEETYHVLTPKISDVERAVITQINPLVFSCSNQKCAKVRQFYSGADYLSSNKRCSCGGQWTQIRLIRYCKCGYAEGVFMPKCPEHEKKAIYRKGNFEFGCRKCSRTFSMSRACPECKQKMKLGNALDSSHYYPFTLSLIDLFDNKKDIFIENEKNLRGEKTILSQYLGLLSQEEYKALLVKGKIDTNEDFENELLKEKEMLKGLPEEIVQMVLEEKRKLHGQNAIEAALREVDLLISDTREDSLKPLAEEVLEYDELIHANSVLTLEEAAQTAREISGGLEINYCQTAAEFGIAKTQVCSGVPIVFAAYGYTRREREGDSIKLQGFRPEMPDKKNIYATRLETEGVLFELDRNKILDWMLQNGLISELDIPRERDEKSLKAWFFDRVKVSEIETFSKINEELHPITSYVYRLVHSISHALIRAAAEICGLDKSSLSEYILPNIPAVFIYCQNSQGFNMGALYNAFQMHFDQWLKLARENSKKCVFDPVCMDREKACAGCLFLNEVSCQHFNKDLDRGFLCGSLDKQTGKKTKGFWED